MHQQVAIIDMGTNTFHLLLASAASSGYKVYYREKAAVKIGVGGINQGMITPEGFERALAAMHEFKKTIETKGITCVRAFGTSALRNAKNGPEIAASIQMETGIEIEIIDGIQEAFYIYSGVRSALSLGDNKSLIIDIGGGSVECIIGNSSQLFWSRSFEIGGQRLLEKFHKHDPMLLEEVDALYQFLHEQLQPLLDTLAWHQPTTLVGSSGTFDTLSDIYCAQRGIDQVDASETPFEKEAFHPIFQELIVKNKAARQLVPGMIDMRVDMIVVACCLIEFILKSHAFQTIRVSSYSLKEGVLASLLESK